MPLLEDGTFVLDDTLYRLDSGVSLCHLCKYFHGKEKESCEAYPNGIPDRYAYSRPIIEHSNVEKDQVGDFIFYI